MTILELSFGVLGDLFGRKQLLVGGAALLCAGEVVAASASGIHQLWAGQPVPRTSSLATRFARNAVVRGTIRSGPLRRVGAGRVAGLWASTYPSIPSCVVPRHKMLYVRHGLRRIQHMAKLRQQEFAALSRPGDNKSVVAIRQGTTSE
ncbi:hypothetical protein AB0P37_21955 [Streptomyces antimycoticus]|uniref:hypothetical protein n=1 Tax=Streptomyces antimycoticus TaxID=68175 RepID=UPI003429DBF3